MWAIERVGRVGRDGRNGRDGEGEIEAALRVRLERRALSGGVRFGARELVAALADAEEKREQRGAE